MHKCSYTLSRLAEDSMPKARWSWKSTLRQGKPVNFPQVLFFNQSWLQTLLKGWTLELKDRSVLIIGKLSLEHKIEIIQVLSSVLYCVSHMWLSLKYIISSRRPFRHMKEIKLGWVKQPYSSSLTVTFNAYIVMI